MLAVVAFGSPAPGNESTDLRPIVDFMDRLTGVEQPLSSFSAIPVPEAEVPDLSVSSDPLAEAVAGQWFGGLVSAKSPEDRWLQDGLAQLASLMYLRDHDRDAFDLARFQAFEGSIDDMGGRGRHDVTAAPAGVAVGSPGNGGCARMLVLMHELGEPVFWRGVKSYLEANRSRAASTDDFFAAMSKSAGKDLKGFEAQWFHSAAPPSLSVAASGNSLVVTQLAPYYTVDLPVWFLVTPLQTTLISAPVWERKVMHVTGASSTLKITADEAKLPFLIDPEAWTPMELTYKAPFTPDQVAQLFFNAPNVTEKSRILGSLFDALPTANKVTAGGKEHNGLTLQLLAPHFGQDGMAFLVALTHIKDPHVVNAGLIGLAKLKPDKPTTARVQTLAAKDSNVSIRQNATAALLAWAPDDKLAATCWKTDEYKPVALGWYIAHQADTARTMALQVLGGPADVALRVAAIEALGVVKDKPNEHAVFDALVSVATGNSVRPRVVAIIALGKLGNPAAVPVLEPIAASGPAYQVRPAAVAALAALGKR